MTPPPASPAIGTIHYPTPAKFALATRLAAVPPPASLAEFYVLVGAVATWWVTHRDATRDPNYAQVSLTGDPAGCIRLESAYVRTPGSRNHLGASYVVVVLPATWTAAQGVPAAGDAAPYRAAIAAVLGGEVPA